MEKIRKLAVKFNGTNHFDSDWNRCVSVAYNYLSSSWVEFFFAKEEDAKEFERETKKLGFATLNVSFDEY